jgi:tetratricopeptide (TPR) repeat protein
MALHMQGEYTTDESGTQLLAAAAAAMRQALEVSTRPAMPQQWALLQAKLGMTLRAQGERTAGERGTQLLAEAVAALRQALEVYTWADVPHDWAATQHSLGIALRAQGERTAGERGTQLLAEAVATYRQALEVRTRAAVPHDWAATQNNLGNALQAQGERTAGERGTRLLTAAVAAFRQAMEVYTRADAPRRWAIVQNNVAQSYMLLKDWPNALTSYLHVLHASPESQEAYQGASYLSHEVFFQFPQAFALNQQWLERHPEDLGTLSDYAERHFTTSRFAECEQRLTALLVHPDVAPQTIVALRALEIANLLALGEAARVSDKIDTMLETISKQPEDFKVTWSFGGTLYFISQYAPLAPHRDWLHQFFGALIDTDRQAMVTGLEGARASFPAGEK